MGRITINGTISQFSCKLSISPKLWDTKANKASGKSIVAQRINEKLENIKTNIGKQYQHICDRDATLLPKRSRMHDWVSGTAISSCCKHSMST